MDLNAGALSVTIRLGQLNLARILFSMKSIITSSVARLVGLASIHFVK